MDREKRIGKTNNISKWGIWDMWEIRKGTKMVWK